MKRTINYQTRGTCSRAIEIELDGDTVENVRFIGGCDGNTHGIANLVRGMNVNDVIEKLSGIKCGFKSTSCPDQLACALKKELEENK